MRCLTAERNKSKHPNVHKDYSSAAVSSFSSITSTFTEVAPHVGDYEYAYDMWINGVATPGLTR